MTRIDSEIYIDGSILGEIKHLKLAFPKQSMTVISVLKLGESSGIACADERESHGGRQYDVAKKIYRLTDYAFTGFSGNVWLANEVVASMSSRLKGDMPLADLSKLAEEAYREARDRKFRSVELAKYGVSWEEFKNGRVDAEIKAKLAAAAADDKSFPINFVLIGIDPATKQFTGRYLDYPGYAVPFGNYLCIGSGSDRAELLIGDKLHSMKPEERANINLAKGCRIVMEATQSAWRNFGVGGRSQVVWINNGEQTELDYRASNILNNLVFCSQRGVVSTDFVDDMFKQIVENKGTPADAMKEVEGKIDKDAMLRLFFEESLHL